MKGKNNISKSINKNINKSSITHQTREIGISKQNNNKLRKTQGTKPSNRKKEESSLVTIRKKIQGTQGTKPSGGKQEASSVETDGKKLQGTQGTKPSGGKQEASDTTPENNKKQEIPENGEKKKSLIDFVREKFGEFANDFLTNSNFTPSSSASRQPTSIEKAMTIDSSGGSDYIPTKIEIVEVITSLLKISTYISRVILYLLCVMMFLWSVVNIIIYIVIVLTDFFCISNDDTIIRDTMKYKLLYYSDIVLELHLLKKIKEADTKNNNAIKENAIKDNIEMTTEPYFYLLNVYNNSELSILIYIVLFIIFILSILVIAFVLLVVKFFFRSWEFDELTDTFQKSKIIEIISSADLYMPIAFIGFIYVVLKYYFRGFMINNMNNIKKSIYELDSYILSSLSDLGQGLDENVYQILSKRSKRNINGEEQKINEIIKKNINSGNLNAAKQNTLYYTYYSHIHDNIPETNSEAIKLIDKFFLNVDKSDKYNEQGNQNNNVTYVSLMVNSKGINLIDMNIYKKLEIFQGSNPEAMQVLKYVDDVIEEVKNKITKMPEISNMSIYFAILFIILLYGFAILLIIYGATISTSFDKKNINPQTYDSSLTILHNFSYYINYIIAYIPGMQLFYYLYKYGKNVIPINNK